MDLLQLNALGVLFQKFGNAVLGETSGQVTDTAVNKIQTVITNKKIESDFYKCGDIASHFDNNKGLDDFGQTVLTVFSKENLLGLYHKLKKEKGYDYRAFLEDELRKICEQYGIEANTFIEFFIELFLDCIYQADKALYNEIFQGNWREENRNDFDLSHKNEAKIIALLNKMQGSGNSEQYASVIAQQIENNKQNMETVTDLMICR